MASPKHFKCSTTDILYLLLYLFFLLFVILHFPKSLLRYYETRAAIFSFGFLGVWRYGWLGVHVLRSLIYSHWVFPRRRAKADKFWRQGWRPKRLIFMMTTFKEQKNTTERVLQSIVAEAEAVGVPAKLFIGTGTDNDELVVCDFFKNLQTRLSLEVVLVRQRKPGKRYAIGETLRAIQRSGLEENDPVVFMDGDTYFVPGCLRKCLPFFALYPRMQALTTNENAIVCNGPWWMKKWLEMRFAQRHYTMQSYALSDKVLTLTGRMSIFRGKHLREREFIETVEEDRLYHWLWGEYRFLSGDDKSTWYYLLKMGAKMFYIPDAMTTTIENIQGNPYTRMRENIRRWTGNTLRNGARAIALGPRKVGLFTWWCLLDQRLTMWTMLLGHLVFLVLAFTRTPAFLLVAMVWIAFTRLMISIIMFYYSRSIDMSFPFFLYANQLSSTLMKVYILFRLPQQRWQNRGDQRAGFNVEQGIKVRGWVASYLSLFCCLLCFLLVLLYLGVVSVPSMLDVLVLSS